MTDVADDYFYQLSMFAIQNARAENREVINVVDVDSANIRLQVSPARAKWWSKAFFAIAGGLGGLCVTTLVQLMTAPDHATQSAEDILPSVFVTVVSGLLALAFAGVAYVSESWKRKP